MAKPTTKNTSRAINEWLESFRNTDDEVILKYIQNKTREAHKNGKKFADLPTVQTIMKDLKVGHTKARDVVSRLVEEKKVRRVRDGRAFKIIPCEV